MYKRITLEKFERTEFCNLRDFEFKYIKESIEYNIKVLNDGIADGKDWFDMFMQSYKNELVGMLKVCSMIGIVTEVDYEKEDEIEEAV